jgi:hypothetical protein
MATKAKTPGIPRKPETADVATLMGTWIPYPLPAVFKKNKKSAPMRNLTAACPINLAGLKGAPENKSKRIRPPSTDITTIGSKKCSPPPSVIFNTTYVQVRENRP